MRVPLTQIDPVVIALDQIEVADQVRFSGLDLDTGTRVSVLVERGLAASEKVVAPTHSATGLVLLLTVERLDPRQ